MGFELPCECVACIGQYRYVPGEKVRDKKRYVGQADVSSITTLCQKFCTNVLDNLQMIRSVVGSQWGVIQKRWMKQSNTKRRELLKRLRPDMHEGENVFLDLLLDRCDNPIVACQSRQLFLLPYVTVDNLSKGGSRLLCLLYYRTVHLPHEWVAFDKPKILAGWTEGALEGKFNPG